MRHPITVLWRAQIDEQAGAIFHDGPRIDWTMQRFDCQCAVLAVDKVA